MSCIFLKVTIWKYCRVMGWRNKGAVRKLCSEEIVQWGKCYTSCWFLSLNGSDLRYTYLWFSTMKLVCISTPHIKMKFSLNSQGKSLISVSSEQSKTSSFSDGKAEKHYHEFAGSLKTLWGGVPAHRIIWQNANYWLLHVNMWNECFVIMRTKPRGLWVLQFEAKLDVYL